MLVMCVFACVCKKETKTIPTISISVVDVFNLIDTESDDGFCDSLFRSSKPPVK